MQELVEDRDREAPLRFVGREPEINLTLRILERVRAGRRAGFTQLITAAPGAGKTALLAELKKLCETRSLARTVTLKAAWFGNAQDCMARFLGALSQKAEQRGREERVRQVQSGARVGAGIALVAGEGTVEQSRSVRLSPKRVSAFADAAEAMKQARADIETPIVVFVDEVQNLGEDMPNGRSSLLMELHEGDHGLPILPVLAGLGDSPAVLQKRGVSRLAADSVHRLGALSHAECEEAVQAIFEKFRIPGSAERRDQWVRAIAGDSQGWPHHLQNGLRGACEALLASGGNLERASLANARKRARARSEEYYAARLDGLDNEREAVCAALQATGAYGGRYEMVRRAAARAIGTAQPREADPILDQIIHNGILQKDSLGRLYCPISSMKAYLEKLLAPLEVNPAEQQSLHP